MTWRTVWSSAGDRLVVEKGSVEGRELHRFRSDAGGAGAVVVASDAEGRVLAVRVPRPMVGRVLWELPRGQGELSDSDVIETAGRELLEETGHVLADARDLGEVYADTGLSADRTHVVAGSASADAVGAGEFDVAWLSGDRIAQRVAAGELRDGLSLAALAVWRSGAD